MGLFLSGKHVMANFNIKKAKENLEKREAQKRSELEKLLVQAQADFERIVEMLITKYRPERIYTWGSLMDPEKFTNMSDIDIALEGLPGPLDGLHAQSDAQEATSFPVDLVELERIHPSHAETIRERGKLVYERG
jgi:predicted nucleotidyltransferase